MGSRGRSIRLRIYFLVAIPLVTMLGLFGYVAYTSITNWMNLDRAPSLIRATSEPLTAFVSLLQNERRAAVVYASEPDAASLTAYQAAVAATIKGESSFANAVRSPATTQDTTPAETVAINKMVTDVTGMTKLRAAVTAKALPPVGVFTAYTKIITDQDTVFQAEDGSITNTVAFSQGLGLIAAVNAREDLSEQDALLAGALASGTLTAGERVAFNDAAGRQHDDTLLYQILLSPSELKTFNNTMTAKIPGQVRKYLAKVQQGVEAGSPLSALKAGGLSPSAWHQLTASWQAANYAASTDAANVTLAVDQRLASNAKRSVWETAAVGATGLILTLLVTILLGRSINRRLSVLRSSALALAEEQLPSVVARLRRGESVDVTAEAPPLRVGSDEIGQVGQAIDTVRQTAIRSAVEEARVRQGVNDMFRNLARRNQSLLQRQLTVLDEAERRATDPNVLEDLFKMDHLTTRMRRHAEGLIILSGAPPGRSWSAPVKLIDVMRGAVAEVEDYARVTVTTQSRAALAGSAVTDVIHLLAELIENATTLSPPFTQVRVSGEPVASGFAIEIEDRGLGMTPQRLAELNDRLANTPEINPANTEQLGLFVVGQLARRHGITVTLRASPYGGTTAVALIPAELIVAEGPVAITAGGQGMADAGPSHDRQETHDRRDTHGHRDTTAAAAAHDWAGTDGPATEGGQQGPPIRISGALRHPGATTGPSGGGSRRRRHGADEVPVVTGVPVRSPVQPPDSSFDVFTPLRRPERDGGTHDDGTHDDGTAASPVPAGVPSYSQPPGQPPAGSPGQPHGVSYSDPGGQPGNGDLENTGAADEGHEHGDSTSDDHNGLPRRVRQANLAPELRASASAAAKGQTGVPPASAASLAVMRDTLSAMQRGWQQGRSQVQRDTEDNASGD